MQLHQLKPTHKHKEKKRLGRGGKHGVHCGKGSEGQKSRAGKRMQPIIRELTKKYPKLRGYKFKERKEVVVLNLEALEKKFKVGETITPKILLERKLIRRIKGKLPQPKILGQGKLTKPLMLKGFLLSKSAKEKIEKAGGKIIK